MNNNIQMYTQMGYSQAQVKKAHEYSQKNHIDMFEALQQLQNRQNAQKQKKTQANIPPYSYLNNIKNINLNEYQLIYSRGGVKQPTYGRDQLRQINTPVGLFNVSNCCYLNSLLQCYFLMGDFTRQILLAQQISQLPQSGSKTKRIKNQYLLMQALKQIFAKMKLSSRRYLDPSPILKNLVNSVGQKIQYGDEKDLNQINMQIVERLSQCLMFTKKYYTKGEGSPSKIKKRQNIKNLFYGQKVQVIDGMQGQTVSDFMGIILNPKHDNIIFALDQQFNYDVEIDGKTMKRHTYLKTLPKYLFLNISRIQKKGNQLCKNSQKIAFDFTIYLDRYLQSNKQQAKLKNPKIRELQNRINIIKSQLNHLNIFAQKLQQCKTHAKFIKGLQEKLPKQQQIDQQKQSLNKQIQKVEAELAQIQSRRQKFVLMYIFVHRGNAISGHYWGYGRNGNKWYRFDVNCSTIKQNQILIDMDKSAGTAYALVYAKQEQLQCFAYPYHTNIQQTQLLVQTVDNMKDYSNFISQRLKKQIIQQNIAMHTSIQKLKNKNIVQDVVKQYKTKYNLVMSQVQNYHKTEASKKISLYINFASYLGSILQLQFMKYNLFCISLHSKAQITASQLLENDKLLKLIQKAFKKKIKGKMTLRHFALEIEPVQGPHYKQQIQQYLIGKKCLEFIKIIHNDIKNWPKIDNLNALIEQICDVLRQKRQGIYIKSVVRELVTIMIIDLAIKRQPIKKSWTVACSHQNPLLADQLKQLKLIQLDQKIKLNATPISQIHLQLDWSILSLKKGFQNEFFNAVRQIVNKLSDGIAIYKKNTKQNEIVKKEVEQQKKQQQDLI